MKRFICIFISMLIMVLSFSSIIIVCSADDSSTDTPSENYAILMETSSKQVLEESNSNVRLQVGTLNKVMVALLIAERVSNGDITLDTELTTSNNAQGKEGATVWLLQGERMSVKDLLKATLIGNANDSTIVLAEYLGDTEEECISIMNDKAKTLGMDNTHFSNVCGYNDTSQYSTAYDMGILGCEILQYTFLHEIMSTYMDYLRDGETELVNENYLTRTYEGLTGIKASHLGDSNYCIIASAEKNNTSYLTVVLNCSDKDSLFKIAKKLLNKGFNSYVTAEPSFSSELMKPLKVKGGTDFAVLVEPKELKSITVAKGSNDIENVMFIPEYVVAPIKKNQRLGEVCFYIDDTMIYKTDLIACNDVEKMDFIKAFKKIFYSILK
ncbi:MAG: D-alanyl-D-alanine carboxypeptidase [Ruminococcus sp.]|nr:D-alanyl-D-alanine carboxypeptidase [Ruminococcus sp.]